MDESKPLISIIVAMAENHVIGRNNELPWRLPADLQHFKALTVGKPIIMGRKTWESLPGLLPERRHIVLTHHRDYVAENCLVVHSMEDAVVAAGDVPEVMIIGGSKLYQQFLPLAQRMYLTLVHAEVEGDALFPRYDETNWQEMARESHPADEKNHYPYTFLTLRRSA
jgi:dihydrofolate reductase